MITRNALIVSVSVVLLLVSVALVLVSGKNVELEEGPQINGQLTQEQQADTTACSLIPTGDYTLCCTNDGGEEVDCTEKTLFRASEKVTIVVNPVILKDIETPYLLCERSDLLPVQGAYNEDNEIQCIEIESQMSNFVIRTDAFVPTNFPHTSLDLLKLTALREDSSSEVPLVLLDIKGSFIE
jgi:hypothetical protein